MNSKRIGIWTGAAYEKWDLDTYRKEGIGGSEICAGRLAETASEHGHTVLMYGYHERKTQYGVQLFPHQEFNPEREKYDLFIASRDTTCLTDKLQASKILVWIHDTQLRPNKSLNYCKNLIDKFIVLSPWHNLFIRTLYELNEDQVDIIPNGVNVEFFDEYDPTAKVFGKLLWTSSPDRGLENLLEMLPAIKREVPQVHLVVTYGFQNCIATAIRNKNPALLKFVFDVREKMRELDYVDYSGKNSQPQIAKLWREAYLWMYPTAFTETFCISAKEAQLSGTPILCSNIAALQTTVGEYGYRVRKDPYSHEGKIEFIQKAIEILTNQKLWLQMSLQARKGAVKLSWRDRWHDYWSKYLS